MVVFRYAAELVDVPSKLLVVMQGSLKDELAKRFEKIFQPSNKMHVGIIEYDAFIELLSEMGVAELPPARGPKNPRCRRCNLVYLNQMYRRCILCGGELGGVRRVREARRFVNVEAEEV